ncbi:hypothetical protein M9H77_02688 [Catharanthus roseus]|uniref:Uncharacterized protein n=1 Tax=Catharanthus roseus TaxID=4058 RepID=A0ACC0C9A5_CATRO|nr:hypothetical protein M9H77_02688 [Catharanthus roseus]
MDLNSLFGFIEAYVQCPTTINRPFLPFQQKNGTLIFPTGEFVGVYYSKELKYARDLGYTVIPISGYLFEKKESPFKSFISSLFKSHLEAKKSDLDLVLKAQKRRSVMKIAASICRGNLISSLENCLMRIPMSFPTMTSKALIPGTQ